MRIWSILALLFISIGCASQQGSLSSTPGPSSNLDVNPPWLVEANSQHNAKVDCRLPGGDGTCRLKTVQRHSPMTVKPLNSRNLKKLTPGKGPLIQTVGKDPENEDLPPVNRYQAMDTLALAPNLLPENKGGHFPDLGGDAFAEATLTEEDIMEAEVPPAAPANEVETPATHPVMQTAKVEPAAPRAEAPRQPEAESAADQPAMQTAKLDAKTAPAGDKRAEAPLAIDPDLLKSEAESPASEKEAAPEAPLKVKVAAGDTLIEIARRFQPGETTRAAVALWMDNKDQFIAGNMNGLQVGTVLGLGNLKARMDEIDQASARRTLKEQWREWTARNQAPAATEDKPETETAKAEPAKDANDGDKAEEPVTAQAAKPETGADAEQPAETAGSDEAPATAQTGGAPESETPAEPLPAAENSDGEAEAPPVAAVPENSDAPQVAKAEPAQSPQPSESKPLNKFQQTLGNLQEKVTNVAEHLWGAGINNFVSRLRGNPLLDKEP